MKAQPAMRARIGPMLLAGQVALTLAIVVNAGSIASDQLNQMLRPSGLDEPNLLSVHTLPLDGSAISPAQSNADLAALRALPGVASASRVNALPLGEEGWRTGVGAKPLGASGPAVHTALYYGDQTLPPAFGVALAEGRSLVEADVGDIDSTLHGAVTTALISRSLAAILFPGESPIGKQVYSRINPPLTIVGMVDRLQSAWPRNDMHENSLLIAARIHLPEAFYLIRTQPGTRDNVAARVAPTLLAVNPSRILDPVRSYGEIRADGYRGQRTVVTVLGGLIGALLFITALGIGGTAAFWVASRVQQIGTRRALGASRGDILQHFMRENFLITSGGVAIGGLLAIGLNRWLIAHYAVAPLGWYFLPAGVLLLYALGQAAVLGPALRAAAVPPAVATRGA
ncbi:MAG TPA: FtsX-like permease family protein [Nevskiaceae bacterium]|nr:FtsX-like permease family protein [Nevskiaceae bacterium]